MKKDFNHFLNEAKKFREQNEDVANFYKTKDDKEQLDRGVRVEFFIGDDGRYMGKYLDGGKEVEKELTKENLYSDKTLAKAIIKVYEKADENGMNYKDFIAKYFSPDRVPFDVIIPSFGKARINPDRGEV